MTTDNWIQIVGFAVTALSTLLSPMVPVWYGKIRDRVKATSVSNQQHQEVEIPQGKLFEKAPYIFYFTSFIAVTVAVGVLIKEIYKPDPITRATIFWMIYYSAIILYHMIFILLIGETYRVNRLMNSINDIVLIQSKHQEQIERILGILEAQEKRRGAEDGSTSTGNQGALQP